MPLPTSHVFIVPSSPTSGHRTLKLVGLTQWEHAKLADILDKVPWIHHRFFNDDGSYKNPIDKWYSEHVGDVPILGTWLDPKRKQPPLEFPGRVPLKPVDLLRGR